MVFADWTLVSVWFTLEIELCMTWSSLAGWALVSAVVKPDLVQSLQIGPWRQFGLFGGACMTWSSPCGLDPGVSLVPPVSIAWLGSVFADWALAPAWFIGHACGQLGPCYMSWSFSPVGV